MIARVISGRVAEYIVTKPPGGANALPPIFVIS